MSLVTSLAVTRIPAFFRSVAERQTIEAEYICSSVFLVLINVHSLEGGTVVQKMSFPAASCAGLWSVSEWSRLYSMYWGLVPSRFDRFWLGCSEGGSR